MWVPLLAVLFWKWRTDSLIDQECTDIFSAGGADLLSTHFSVPTLGRIPLDPSATTLLDASTESIVARFGRTRLRRYYDVIAAEVVAKVDSR